MTILQFRHCDREIWEQLTFGKSFELPCIMQIYAWFFMHCRNRQRHRHTKRILMNNKLLLQIDRAYTPWWQLTKILWKRIWQTRFKVYRWLCVFVWYADAIWVFTFHCSSRHVIHRLSLNHILEEYKYDHMNCVVQTLYNFSQPNIVPQWKICACSTNSTNESFCDNPSSIWHWKKVGAVD